MTAEYNFKNICNLTTRLLGFPDDALAKKSRVRPLQVARAVAGYIGRTEEDINHKTIAKVLKRNRSVIYHYENTHKSNYANCAIYRNTFNKVYKAYKDIDGLKKVFFDGDFMKSYLLKNNVIEKLNYEVILEVKSGNVKCKIKTSYFDFSNQIENINLALKDYHYTIKII
tara:strand:- start:4614 stop:5123 length:510 start_codon:yes stop_codon:yes gene_type:complete